MKYFRFISSRVRPRYPQFVYYDRWMELSRFTCEFIEQSPARSCDEVTRWEVGFLNKFPGDPHFFLSSLPPFQVAKAAATPKNMDTLFLQLPSRGRAISKLTSIQIPTSWEVVIFEHANMVTHPSYVLFLSPLPARLIFFSWFHIFIHPHNS